MRRTGMLVGTLLLALGLALGGCSDDGDEGKDGGIKLDKGADMGNDATPDKSTEDQKVTADIKPDALNVGNMGQGCTKSSECTGAADRCLTMSKEKGASVCSKYCTKDNSKTPLVNEDDCPTGFICSDIKMTDGTSKNYCFQKCTPSFTKNPCPASSKLSCSPSSTRYGGTAQAVCFYSACTSNKDCPIWTQTKCVIDLECASVNKDAFCLSGNCARPGSCKPGGICGPHTLGKSTAKVGDPCKSDLDCMNNGICLEESNSYTGSIGPAFRNGYCVVRYCQWPTELKDFACPTGSACNNLYYGGYCFKSCNPAKADHCRNNAADNGGDYECYDWTNWTVSGVKMVKEPICINASTQTCDSLGSSSCDSLGDTTNSTKMRCQDRYTGKDKTNKKDPMGICLDNTASGKFLTAAPDGGYPDTGAPDAGVPDAGVPDAKKADK